MIILSSGQSNAVGRGLYGKSPADADSRVTVWNNVNDADNVGSAFIAPPDFSTPPWSSNGGNNAFVWFADRAAKELNEAVKLINVANGGLSIANWNPANPNNMYTRILANYAASSVPSADIFLWHQGENDGTGGDSTSVASYKAQFLTLIAALRTSGVIKTDAPIIVGELRSSNASSINTAFIELAAENNLIYLANSAGLIDYDGVHYEGASLHQFGFNRYWDKYREHIGFERKEGAISFI